ncbi:MAG: hypothetical protein ETSY2_09615 [Candidatus Entotheonella gemina]|uniref:Tail sheath protein subtilisin-like domain-containing protein n=1 Tax=Candidatus Entotheonella gemina TaxID=1429439 RepID=W4MDK3_9BACT|nr:MAG: hypothetical protein ETSY2_09615 [Candidatus Entotheonella gemina]
MADDATPGVYWQDVFSSPPPPFLTGIPAFLGYANGNGKPGEDAINQPQLLTLWPHFEQRYGVPPDTGYLAYAVRGFFENGGLMCYVVRLDEAVSPKKALKAGLKALAPLERIDLVCAPDIMRATANPANDRVDTLQCAVLKHCQELGDRFAILDTLNTDTAETVSVRDQRQSLSSSYGAIYYPWLVVSDPKGNPHSIGFSGSEVQCRTDNLLKSGFAG